MWLVGGFVRDALRGEPSKDIDIEVFGIPPENLENILNRCFEVMTVGKAFGVFKLRGLEVDVALPRREHKAGTGHKGFEIDSDPFMTEKSASQRRDFTINAIYWDPLSGKILDPLRGEEDLKQGLLRHCSNQFSEDPLRVLRAMQFIARFNLEVDPSTLELCRSIPMEGLPPERIMEEWRKLILKGIQIKRGLDFLADSRWIRFFPEIDALRGCQQEPEWHPEGDVFTHTGHCLDAFARNRLGIADEDWIVGLAVLCHDMGKPATTEFTDGRIRSRGHPESGEKPTRSFLARLTRQVDLVEAVVVLVREHHRPLELYTQKPSNAAIRRLARRVKRIDRLVRVAQADRMGRPPLPAGTVFPEGEWLLQKAETMKIAQSAPTPIVLGRHLIDLGLSPGPAFKGILDQCFEAQLDGQFHDLESGIAFAQSLIKSS